MMICSIDTPFTRVEGSRVGVGVGVGVKVGVAVAVAVGVGVELGIAVAVDVGGIVAVAVPMRPVTDVGCASLSVTSVMDTGAEAAEPTCPQPATRINRAKKMKGKKGIEGLACLFILFVGVSAFPSIHSRSGYRQLHPEPLTPKDRSSDTRE